MQMGMVRTLLHILDTSKSKDLLYWSLVVVHQLAQIQTAKKQVRYGWHARLPEVNRYIWMLE